MEDINNINLVIMDGHLKINNIKIYISLFIKVKIIIIIKNQFNFLKGTDIFLIFFTIFLGINLLLLSNDLLIFTISWELFNLSLYLLVSLNNYSSESSLSASLKYFILSALSTGFLLLGISIIYYILGSTSFDNIRSSLEMINPVYTDLIIFLILSTFIFKLGAAPFYNWAPERGCGKSSIIGTKLSNSGNTLELKIPNHIRKGVSGWSNYPCMVTSLKASEKNVGNRGSKSDGLLLKVPSVKEQRVYGSWKIF